MEARSREVEEKAQQHVCISLPETENLVPPPHPLFSPRRPHTMDSNYYPRADSDSDDSTHKTEEEDPPSPAQSSQADPYPPPSPLSSPSVSSSPSPPFLRHQHSESDDLLCNICTCLLHNPMSLHCGHTFCQLCLAAMWRSADETVAAVDLKCPVCRSSWRNFPGVNIQLRNIIERNYPGQCRERVESLQLEDHQLLARFRVAKEKESKVKDNGAHLRREEVRRLVTGLCCIFAIIMTLMMIGFSLVFWTWAGAEGEFMRKPVGQWSQRDVAEWVEGLGSWASKNYSDIFLHEHISGPRLLHLDEDALRVIGVKDSYRRRFILRGIQDLKEAEFNSPRNFHEFKAGHRRQTLMVALFFTVWPRFTLFYCYTFHYHEIFLPLVQDSLTSQREGGEAETVADEKEREEVVKELGYIHLAVVFLEILVAPHVLVAFFVWGCAVQYPWIAYPVLVHCGWESWREVKVAIRSIRSGNWAGLSWNDIIIQLSRLTVKHGIFFAFFFTVFSVVWYITPHFLCDLFFSYLIWHTVIYLLFWIPLQKLRRHCGAGHFRAQIHMNFNRHNAG